MSSSTKFIEQCYLSFVNLKHRQDRLQRMIQSLTAAGLGAYRTPGMLPNAAIEEARIDPKRVEVMRRRTPGAIGCHFSQVKIMRKALQRGLHAWVMEDDLVFCSDFQERLGYMADFLETHPWDVLWLGGTFHVNPPWWHKETLGRDAELTDDPRMIRTYGAFCTYAYVVNVASLPTVLSQLDQLLDKSIGIDWAFIQMQPNLYTYAFVPGSVIQYDNQSDIGKGPTIFSGFKKLGPYWYQEKAEDFDPTKYNWAEAHRRT